eukprot:TRINITY_DN20562_c0_g1_i1.p1 TRINITY_DN20562_c0_g1~~TRINITY_DN20562_c0_g1_i1.p1  ORF type:complete len:886 (-),score=88.55 TRINITY_DN20562_c0_g1_i1:360-3017(-)
MVFVWSSASAHFGTEALCLQRLPEVAALTDPDEIAEVFCETQAAVNIPRFFSYILGVLFSPLSLIYATVQYKFKCKGQRVKYKYSSSAPKKTKPINEDEETPWEGEQEEEEKEEKLTWCEARRQAIDDYGLSKEILLLTPSFVVTCTIYYLDVGGIQADVTPSEVFFPIWFAAGVGFFFAARATFTTDERVVFAFRASVQADIICLGDRWDVCEEDIAKLQVACELVLDTAFRRRNLYRQKSGLMDLRSLRADLRDIAIKEDHAPAVRRFLDARREADRVGAMWRLAVSWSGRCCWWNGPWRRVCWKPVYVADRFVSRFPSTRQEERQLERLANSGWSLLVPKETNSWPIRYRGATISMPLYQEAWEKGSVPAHIVALQMRVGVETTPRCWMRLLRGCYDWSNRLSVLLPVALPGFLRPGREGHFAWPGTGPGWLIYVVWCFFSVHGGMVLVDTLLALSDVLRASLRTYEQLTSMLSHTTAAAYCLPFVRLQEPRDWEAWREIRDYALARMQTRLALFSFTLLYLLASLPCFMGAALYFILLPEWEPSLFSAMVGYILFLVCWILPDVLFWGVSVNTSFATLTSSLTRLQVLANSYDNYRDVPVNTSNSKPRSRYSELLSGGSHRNSDRDPEPPSENHDGDNKSEDGNNNKSEGGDNKPEEPVHDEVDHTLSDTSQEKFFVLPTVVQLEEGPGASPETPNRRTLPGKLALMQTTFGHPSEKVPADEAELEESALLVSEEPEGKHLDAPIACVMLPEGAMDEAVATEPAAHKDASTQVTGTDLGQEADSNDRKATETNLVSHLQIMGSDVDNNTKADLGKSRRSVRVQDMLQAFISDMQVNASYRARLAGIELTPSHLAPLASGLYGVAFFLYRHAWDQIGSSLDG